MIMFLSSFEGIIDSKNRISIPSSFRSTIIQSKEKIYLFRSLKYSCLEVHLASKINTLIKSFDEKDFFSKKNDHFKTAILSDLEERCISRHSYFKLLNINVFSLELLIVDLNGDGMATLFFESIIP